MKKTIYTKFNRRVETWSFEKLSKLEPVTINRDTDPRLVKVMKRLEKKYLPTHSIMFVGRAIEKFGKYKKGDLFRLDGNTRMAIYEIRPDLIPQIQFTVIIFDIDNLEDLKDIYYSIDSMDAVEKSSDKMTGLLRDKMFVPKTPLFKKGQFKRALDVACQYGNSEKGEYLQVSHTSVKLDHYWKEFMFLDKMGIDNKHSRYSPNVLGCFFMIAKKYGVKNQRLEILIENFKNGITTVNNTKSVDGVHHVYHNLYEKRKDTWKLSTWSSSKGLVSPMLYCFDMFMRNENISKTTKFPSDTNLEEFFQFYNERH